MTSAKVALVTGAGSGIGRASAVVLADEGYSVGLLGRTMEDLEAVADDIKRKGGDAFPLLADVSDDQQMVGAIAELIERCGRLDAVVANAGINGVWAPIEELKPDEWDQTININLRGTYLTIHHAVPHMKSNGGSITIVSSINGSRTFTSPGATAYSATKAGQVAIGQQLALELARYKIRVNVVCPGAIDTEIDDNTQIRSENKTSVPVEWPQGTIPLSAGQAGRSEDMADLIAFLASDKARHITGSPVWIDGAQGLLV